MGEGGLAGAEVGCGPRALLSGRAWSEGRPSTTSSVRCASAPSSSSTSGGCGGGVRIARGRSELLRHEMVAPGCDFEWLPTSGVRVTVRKQRRRQQPAALTPARARRSRCRSRASAGAAQGPGGRSTCHRVPLRCSRNTSPGRTARLGTGCSSDPAARRSTRRRSERSGWTPLIAELFPEGHRLAGITPHALRHIGITNWLRRGLSLPLIQKWGGGSSLKVMLDVYAAVLPDDEDRAIELLEEM